jgi:hypothetical protein
MFVVQKYHFQQHTIYTINTQKLKYKTVKGAIQELTVDWVQDILL